MEVELYLDSEMFRDSARPVVQKRMTELAIAESSKGTVNTATRLARLQALSLDFISA